MHGYKKKKIEKSILLGVLAGAPLACRPGAPLVFLDIETTGSNEDGEDRDQAHEPPAGS